MSYSRDVNLFDCSAQSMAVDQAVYSLEFYPSGVAGRVLYGSFEAISAFIAIAKRHSLAYDEYVNLVFPSQAVEDFDGNFWLTSGEIYLAKVIDGCLRVRRVADSGESHSYYFEVKTSGVGVAGYWGLAPYAFSALDRS